eukprot:432119-Amphidinium_carterae.2
MILSLRLRARRLSLQHEASLASLRVDEEALHGGADAPTKLAVSALEGMVAVSRQVTDLGLESLAKIRTCDDAAEMMRVRAMSFKYQGCHPTLRNFPCAPVELS